ncbi:MAG: serine hydrolase [Thermoanaerobaculia bacterium]
MPENLEGGRITVRQEIRKLFLVSDNRAFNRLFELVGQDGLAASLARAGLGEARIVHRLSESSHRRGEPPGSGDRSLGEGVRTSLPERLAPEQPLPPLAGLEVGEAYLAAEAGRIDQPLSFAAKNRVALGDLQRGLCKVVRPEVDCGGPPFALSMRTGLCF